MEQKSPVEIVQELIAMHTSRKEAYQKIQANEAGRELQDKLDKAIQQSEQFTAELMQELSGFGDAVLSEVDRQNGFEQTYKQVMNDLKTMDASALQATFQQLEDKAKDSYNAVTAADTDLPETLRSLVHRQAAGL